MKYITSTFRVPEALYEKLRIEAFNNRVSLAEIMRKACEEYIKTKELKVHIGANEPNSEINSGGPAINNIPS